MTVTADVVAAIISHHAELQQTLTRSAAAVVTAARRGAPFEEALQQLGLVLVNDVIPHARAEEDVLYAAATAEKLRPLVTGMIFEHETITSLARDLVATRIALEAAAAARAIEAVFVGHVRRENELLLPALAADPEVDLPALLPVMQERFAAYRAAAL